MKKINRPKGLGDSIENFTKTTGIKSLTEMAVKGMNKITGLNKGCGCGKRKNWLNKQFPYKQY